MLRFSNKINLLIAVLLGLAVNSAGKDERTSYATMEPALTNAPPLPEGLTEADLQALPIGAPLLRAAYAQLFLSGGGPLRVDARNPQMMATMNDLRRRGDTATPLLLDMMGKNPNTDLENITPLFVGMLGSFNMAPYLKYIRGVVRNRPTKIDPSACEAFTTLFAAFGSQDDIAKIQRLAVHRPSLASSVQRALETHGWKGSTKHPAANLKTAENIHNVLREPTEKKRVASGNPLATKAVRAPEVTDRQSPVPMAAEASPLQRLGRVSPKYLPAAIAGAVVLLVIVGFVQGQRRSKP